MSPIEAAAIRFAAAVRERNAADDAWPDLLTIKPPAPINPMLLLEPLPAIPKAKGAPDTTQDEIEAIQARIRAADKEYEAALAHLLEVTA